MVKSDFKLHIFKILNFSWFQLFVINGLASFKATTSVKPAILIQIGVMLHFDKNADLCHYHVTVANITALDINACSA